MRRSINSRGTAFLMAGALALFLFAVGNADAALTKDQQNCVNTLNKNLQKVAATYGKEWLACIKDFNKGRNGVTDITLCMLADRKGKIAGVVAKAASDDAKRCTGNDRKGDPKHPGVLATSALNNSVAASGKEANMIGIIFGSDVGVTEAENKHLAKAQEAVAKRLFKCQDTAMKEFNTCKRSAIKLGKAPFPNGATTASELETCILDDPKFKIAKFCDMTINPKNGRPKLDAIRKELKKAVAKGAKQKDPLLAFDLCDVLPHCCPPCAGDDVDCIHQCIQPPVANLICETLNTADALNKACP